MIINKIKIGTTEYDIGAEYQNINGTPTLSPVATSGVYSDLSGTPNLSAVATSGAYNDLSGKPTNLSDFQNDEGFIDNTVNDLQNYTKSVNNATKLVLELNSNTFKLKGILKDSLDNVIFTSNEIDLPLETMVVGATYDDTTKTIILTLQNGSTTSFSVADLVSGLVSQTGLETALSNYYTKGQVDAKVQDAEDNANTYTDNSLLNYYDKTQTYNKTEIDTAVSGAEASAKSYADTVSGTAETNAKTYADGVGTTATTNANSYTDGKVAGKQDILQYLTMPTASVETLGKIVQYIGATDNDYTQGYFYIGVSDNEETPTYSWLNIEVQTSSGGGVPVFKYVSNEATMRLVNMKTELEAWFAYYIANGYFADFYWVYNSGTNLNTYKMRLPMRITKVTLLGVSQYEIYYRFEMYEYNTSVAKVYTCYSYFYVSDNTMNTSQGTLTATQKTFNPLTAYKSNLSSEDYTNGLLALPTNNMQVYTPTSDYNPATKVYVDIVAKSATYLKDIMTQSTLLQDAYIKSYASNLGSSNIVNFDRVNDVVSKDIPTTIATTYQNNSANTEILLGKWNALKSFVEDSTNQATYGSHFVLTPMIQLNSSSLGTTLGFMSDDEDNFVIRATNEYAIFTAYGNANNNVYKLSFENDSATSGWVVTATKITSSQEINLLPTLYAFLTNSDIKRVQSTSSVFYFTVATIEKGNVYACVKTLPVIKTFANGKNYVISATGNAGYLPLKNGAKVITPTGVYTYTIDHENETITYENDFNFTSSN